jgi:hypothetical protein
MTKVVALLADVAVCDSEIELANARRALSVCPTSRELVALPTEQGNETDEIYSSSELRALCPDALCLGGGGVLPVNPAASGQQGSDIGQATGCVETRYTQTVSGAATLGSQSSSPDRSKVYLILHQNQTQEPLEP